MPQSLIAFDTDHIKSYVFGTSKLKEIRGASSLLDELNRVLTEKEAQKFNARKIFAHGGSALFLLESENAEEEARAFGQAVQKRYRQKTGGGASITYAVQPIPPHDQPDILRAVQVTPAVSMDNVLQMLRLRLRLAKEGSQTSQASALAQPTHPFLSTCKSCGLVYAETMMADYDEPESQYCRVCTGKRHEDERIKKAISHILTTILPAANQTEDEAEESGLWQRILSIMSRQDRQGAPPYAFEQGIGRPRNFQAFRELGDGRGYLGLIYADANSMGQALEERKTLLEVQQFAERIDNAVFEAVGEAIKQHLPARNGFFPFDVLLIGGDDIVLVTPADKALDVAHTLAERFFAYSDACTLSVGVVLAPIAYPFHLQLKLAEEMLQDAKRAGAVRQMRGHAPSTDKGYLSFVVVTGSTSLSYKKIYSELHFRSLRKKEEFYATLRPYTLQDFKRLLSQLQAGKKLRLGRSKLHQLREAILKLNRTTTILESLALFRNWNQTERDFIRGIVQELDEHITPQERERRGTLFPWYLEIERNGDTKDIYRTPLLDFIELYDFVTL